MHFQNTEIPFYPGIPWRRHPTNAHAGNLNWIRHALRPLSADMTFTCGLQHLPTAAPLALWLLLVSLLVKGMAMME